MAEDNIDNSGEEKYNKEDSLREVLPVSGLYQNWFLDYASYVILERAVPAINDGFKPVQRRIMHSLKEMDDGRFNKVANVIGNTMQYHPHGDASIGDAIINLGQKDLLIETQGNWGDIRTGDSAAAPRYIEARLSKFALEVTFNAQLTNWQLSYDGRKKEPETLPVKFPLLLTQGVEGIAVGLSTKILPHNFCELIKASIDILKGKKPKVYPDFPTGGAADFSEYNEGQKGGKVKVRAKIEVVDKKHIAIKEIPYATTTNSIIDSIIKANDKGKIKIKQVVDNTAKEVEVLVTLAPGQSPDITIDALYAFTDCEVSISPNACVIIDEKPRFMSVNDILKYNTDQTVDLLRKELEIKKAELLEKILFSSLEKIFIENRIYRDIEECETWEAVIETIDQGLEPFKPDFYREITEEDIVKLTEIKIKRISKFDTFKADELMRRLEEDLKETEHHLNNIIDYSINYYAVLLEKFGKGKERKTEIRSFETIAVTQVVANNQKLYVNRKEGFIGYGLKKDEYVCDCSDIDDIIVIRRDGNFLVSRISDKVFMGKDILYVGVWKKGDERTTYNLIYLDGKSGKSMAKRFNVKAITRDKEYPLTKGEKGSKILYFTCNPNGEAEVVTVKLTQSSTARKKIFEYDFADLEIKGRAAGGNTLTKYPVRKVELKTKGVSTLSGLNIWYDENVGRLNNENRGELLGEFNPEDQLFVAYKNGAYEMMGYALSNRYEPSEVFAIKKYREGDVIATVYYDGDSKNYYVKRFKIETSTANKRFPFISDHSRSKLILVTSEADPQVEIVFEKGKGKEKETTILDLNVLIDVKGWKSLGNRLSQYDVKKVKLLAPKKDTKKETIISDEAEAPSTSESNNKSKDDDGEDYGVGETIKLDF